MSTPPPAINKAESRRIRVEIRHVLLDQWDPIGVKNEPNAHDEYDGYLGDIFGLLTAGASDAEIAKYLDCVSRERMGLRDAPDDVMTATVLGLRSIRIEPASSKE